MAGEQVSLLFWPHLLRLLDRDTDFVTDLGELPGLRSLARYDARLAGRAATQFEIDANEQLRGFTHRHPCYSRNHDLVSCFHFDFATFDYEGPRLDKLTGYARRVGKAIRHN